MLFTVHIMPSLRPSISNVSLQTYSDDAKYGATANLSRDTGILQFANLNKRKYRPIDLRFDG